MNEILFAEIDIEPAPVSKADPPTTNTPFRESLPIAPRTPDPIRERFYEMRGLATKRPYPRNDSELFYRQARFMEDFEDSFEGDAKFNMYFPYYQRMGYDYLRTYFTWRTKVRGGEIRQTSLSYIFLYIYELLSGIGVKDPDDGLSKLMDIWGVFAKKHSAIETNLAKWLKDYHVYYGVPHSLQEFAAQHDMQKHYTLTMMFDTQAPGQLKLYNSISGYDITKSRFYNDGNEELLSKCFDFVINAIQDFCKSKGASFEDMLVYSVSTRRPWKPFENALFGSRVQQADREVHISKYERYYCKNGEWTANLPIYYSSQKDFIGYLIKKTESYLRAAVGYKYKLTAEMRPGAKPFRELQRPAAKRAELDKVIEQAVGSFYKDINRIVVAVDHSSLARIREEALETQEQLIVEEEIAEITEDSALTATVSDESTQTLSFADGWRELKKLLTDTEKETLHLALSGGDIKTFALEKNIMLEVLLDGINEKASDCIGDSILELTDEIYIFDEYRSNITEIV